MNDNLNEIMTALLDYVRTLVEAETLEDVKQSEQLAKLETLTKERTDLVAKVQELKGLLTQLEQKVPQSTESTTPEVPVEPPVTVEPSPDSPVMGEV
jgi:peptidoglycan hydrolase CwlO-like protein